MTDHPVAESPDTKETTFAYERRAYTRGFRSVAGVDEAGRGPLAGPVVAAAVVLPLETPIAGLTDSKQLSAAARDRLFPAIKETARSFGIGIVDVETIDRINILQASRLAMKLAVERLAGPADFLLIDGINGIDAPVPQQTIVSGDCLSFSIAAASVLAKVTRDRLMAEYHAAWPRYGFNRHKGYGTRAHLERIKEFGPCPIHRRTFKGVK